MLTYIRRLQSNIGPNDVITIVIPEFETKKMWHMLLHNQSGMLLRLRLLREKNIIITTVPLMLK
ncbi:hypothetical protein HMPREF1250_1938 [Megasphaera vaginalis (ex Srinivasan et al. 2021)]|uniref:Uncharacterized protein n=1 Tax=Megasphaera vaginalis (ex Srinivasan et al. 2021) TaxID=1111454 RepID=U7USV7_9FIRM|nr:hypothetical protein HMPREF1250_1938 [Megasphaera vaginalis (ex Srinivasan et al. 2021)]